MDTITDERFLLMAELDEKTMREVFDRLHAIEANQSTFEKEQAVLKVEFLGVVRAINEKLADIAEGRNKNCMEHKAELTAMRLVADTLRTEFDNYKAAQAAALQEQERAIRARYNLVWAALVMGTFGLLFQAVPWVLRAAINAGGG